MPRKIETEYAKRRQILIDRYVEKFYDAAVNSIERTVKELCKEASNIFDSCIDQFYLYQTKSYRRHEVGKGTGTGINLYRANQIHLNYKGGELTSFYIEINADNMAPYKSYKNGEGRRKLVSAKYVLDNVMKGIRGLEDEYIKNGFASYDNHWSATVNTKYFGTLSGTPNQIFDIFDSHFKEIAFTVNNKYRRDAFRKINIR